MIDNLPEGCSESDVSPPESKLYEQEIGFTAIADFTEQTGTQHHSCSMFANVEVGWKIEASARGMVLIEHWLTLNLPECAEPEEIEEAIQDKMYAAAQKYGFSLSDIELI